VNSDDNYQQYIRKILKSLKKYEKAQSFAIDNEAIVAEKNYTQIVIRKKT
jgi:hypothetical protein